MKRLYLIGFLTAAFVANFGCQQQQQTASLDEPITVQEEEQVQQQPSGLALLWPGNWGKGKTESQPPQIVFEEEEEKGGVLETLALLWPGNWDKDKAEPEPEDVTLDSVLRDMSPELTTRAETNDESRVRDAHTIDTNTRSIWDDIRMGLLLDRPSRLSLYPTP